MRILAVSDVHSPRYLSEFKRALERCSKPDVFLFAGDMIDAGKLNEYNLVVDAILERFEERVPVVACLGNSEQKVTIQSLRATVGEKMIFLDGETTTISTGDKSLGILGAPIVDISNNKQDRSIEEVFESRIQLMAHQLGQLNQTCDHSILLLHYSPLSVDTFPESFSWWVSRTFEEAQPDLVIHGHIHYATKAETLVDKTRVFNVALPSAKKITEILI
ncbi:MAG: metallophosphoesterase [Candidatus Thorarchaeota archaeon]